MATLVTKVRNMSGSSTELTSNSKVVTFLQEGTKRVLNSLPENMLIPFSTYTSISNGSGYNIENKKVIEVSLLGRETERVSSKDAYSISNSDSLLYPTSRFPKHYQRGPTIFIKPDPTAGSQGRVDYVDIDGIANAISTTTTTGWKLDSIEHLIVTYSAGMDMLNIANYYAEKGTTALESITDATGEARDALDKAKYIIDDNTQLSQGEDAENWLAEEDVEMISGSVTIARQEIERALAEMQLNKGESSGYSGYVSLYVQAGLSLLKEFQQGLIDYMSNTDAMIMAKMAGGAQ